MGWLPSTRSATRGSWPRRRRSSACPGWLADAGSRSRPQPEPRLPNLWAEPIVRRETGTASVCTAGVKEEHMRTRWLRTMLTVFATLALVAAACAGDEGDGGATGPTAATGPTGATATGPTAPTGPAAPCDTAQPGDLLSRICDEGVIRVSTDPAYPPHSVLNENTQEFEGFDIDVATEIANRLGVEVEWKTPQWTAITSGGWSDRWDMSVGSMTVTTERAEVLHFTPAYYYTPASVAIHVDNTTISDLATDLDGLKIGVCAACTYDFFLQKTLEIPGYTFD